MRKRVEFELELLQGDVIVVGVYGTDFLQIASEMLHYIKQYEEEPGELRLTGNGVGDFALLMSANRWDFPKLVLGRKP